MSLSPLVSFKSRFVTYLLNFPRIKKHTIKIVTFWVACTACEDHILANNTVITLMT